MFVDEITINVKAGNGGNGCVAFRHEKFVEKGGPSGGNGGRGGDIIFVGDKGLTTLIDFKFHRIIKAKSGQNGMPKDCFGADSDDVYVRVPLGTVVTDLATNAIIADITKDKEEVIIAKGGNGGRGNASFANSRVTAPKVCEKGLPGEEKELKLELKMLADVGLVGFPSVGKSTLLSVVSAAKPKIAAYHFTTLAPNLGVVRVKDGRSFVMADLPGLIEGASNGLGLGFRFLKHVERTRVLVHVIDMAGIDGRDPYEDYVKINEELGSYDPLLLKRPQVICANKMDMPESKENLEKFMGKVDVPVIPISAYTKDNLDELLYKIADLIETVNLEELNAENEQALIDEVVEYKFTPSEAPFKIEVCDDGVYEVSGPMVKKYFEITDFTHDANVKLFARRLRQLGVDDALRELGVKHGDTVRILGYEFEFLD